MLNVDLRGRRVITSAKINSPNTTHYLNLFWNYSIERAAQETLKRRWNGSAGVGGNTSRGCWPWAKIPHSVFGDHGDSVPKFSAQVATPNLVPSS